jgi:hypothetical protein
MSFVSTMRAHFRFLVDEAGFEAVKSRADRDVPTVVYRRHDLTIVVSYETREQYLQVVFFRASDTGPDGLPLRGARGFSLDDIVKLRRPEAVMKPWYEHPAIPEFSDYVARFAANLRDFATDVLSGDTSVFAEVEKVQRARAAQSTSGPRGA